MSKETRINWNTRAAEELIDAFFVANRRDLLRLFLEDLLTKNEIEQCIQRLQAVKWLLIGTPYEFVHYNTRLSSSTLSRLSKLLINKQGGFQEIADQLKYKRIRRRMTRNRTIKPE
jgi:uncharacterized protein YerC